MNFPFLEEIVSLNRDQIQQFGGWQATSDNLEHPQSLEWVLDAIQYTLYGVSLYPHLAGKAGILAWTIITRHVFFDGSKRTAMATLIYFLGLNGYQLDVTQDEIIETSLKIAEGHKANSYTLEEFVKWIQGHLVDEVREAEEH